MWFIFLLTTLILMMMSTLFKLTQSLLMLFFVSIYISFSLFKSKSILSLVMLIVYVGAVVVLFFFYLSLSGLMTSSYSGLVNFFFMVGLSASLGSSQNALSPVNEWFNSWESTSPSILLIALIISFVNLLFLLNGGKTSVRPIV